MKNLILTVLLMLNANVSFAQSSGTINVPITPGSTIVGATKGDYTGESFISVGDVNGDGFPDFLVNARNSPISAVYGYTYLIYGQPNVLPTSINISAFWYPNNPVPGVIIAGDLRSASGQSIAAAGDVNRDGFKDILLSYFDMYSENSARTYLLYGGRNLPSIIKLSDVGSTVPGASFIGVRPNALASGDINGDGYPDILIGDYSSKTAFLIYGKAELTGQISINATTSVSLTLDNLNGSVKVTTLDINKDGYTDILLTSNKNVYIIFGKAENLTSMAVTDSFLNGVNGVKLTSWFADVTDPIGDINSDGYPDIAVRGDTNYNWIYKTVIVFGKAAWAPAMDLGSRISNGELNGSNGFTLLGLGRPAVVGGPSSAPAGDYNSDGKTDAIFGDFFYNNIGPGNGAGRAVILFGKTVWPAEYSLITNIIDGTESMQFVGTGYFGNSVGYLDNAFGGDGCGINVGYLIGAPGYGLNIGKAYIVNLTK